MVDEDAKFDALTRDLARGISRRQSLRLILGSLGGGAALTIFGRIPSAAAMRRTHWRRCADLCLQQDDRDLRRSCFRACAKCHGDVSGICHDGGTAFLCCAEGTICCASFTDEVCCPTGSTCCTNHRGGLTCCPPGNECCGGSCCESGHACCEAGFSATCCPEDQTCCFDPTLSDNRCGIEDPATGICVPS